MGKILQKHHTRGFTLVELAIVMIIGGVMLASATALLLTYTKKTHITTTQQRLAAIDEALQLYLSLNGRYPCVADPTAAPDSANFGREIAACNTAPAAAGGRGGRAVRIGSVPVRTLNLPDEFIIDSWSGRFTYAVTHALATPLTYNRDEGGIFVVDSAGNSVIATPGTGHYTVTSHGENHSGARPLSGAAAFPCPAAAAQENENCNGDATFRRTTITSTSNTNTHFDDFVRVRASSSFGEAVPPGAVVAYNLSACPQGWIQFAAGAGRTIIGAGPGFAIGDSGGTAQETLTHAQAGVMVAPNFLTAAAQTTAAGTQYLRPTASSITSHNNLPPYHVLLLCEKT